MEKDLFTPRERQVLELLSLGRSNGEIAAALGMKLQVVKNYIHWINRKTGAKSRVETALWFNSSKGDPAARQKKLLDDIRWLEEEKLILKAELSALRIARTSELSRKLRNTNRSAA